MAENAIQNTLLRSKPFDPVGTIVRHWFKIIVFGGLLFIFLAPAAFILSKPYYAASGKLRVSPVIQSFISRTEEASITSYYSSFVRTLEDRIKEPKIIEKAIDKLPSGKKKFIKPDSMPLSLAAKIIGRRLKVTHLRGTHLVEIGLTGDSPKGLGELINLIMEVYIEEYQLEEEGKDSRRLSYLLKEKERLESDIDVKAKDLQKISEEIAANAFILKEDQPSQFQSAYEIAFKDRVQKENNLKAIVDEAEALKQLRLDARVDEIVEQNRVVAQLDILSQQSIHDLRSLQSGMADDNPGKEQIEERIEEITKYADDQKALITEKTRQLLNQKRAVELEERIIRAKTEFEAAKNTEEKLLKERDKLLAERARVSPKILDRQQLEDNLDQMRRMLNRIDERIHELKLESKASGRIILESLADSPNAPEGDNFKKLFIMIFAFSFGSITGVCVLFDIMDNRVRKDKDVMNGIGTSPHRPIPDYLLTGFVNIPFHRVTLDDPTSKASQSIFSKAIRLDKERKEHDAKVAVFTGVDSKSGVTEILLNTAHAMSRFCSRVLIIEANLSNPVINRLVNNEKKQKGLVDFLLDQSPLKECISHDKDRGIDLLLAGHLPNNDEIVRLDRSKISQLLDKFKEDYDFILIDTSPILVSDLTEFLTIQADVVPLIIQGDRSLYRHLYMAGQALLRLEVPAITAILNWGAPKYQTEIQRIIFKILWPIQSRIQFFISRNLHNIPSQSCVKNKKISQSAKKDESISPAIRVVDIKHVKKLRPVRYQIGIFLAVLMTLLLTLAITMSKNKTDLAPENVVRKPINYTEKKINISKSVSPILMNRYAYASRVPVSKRSYLASLKSLSELSDKSDTTLERPQSHEKDNGKEQENINNSIIQPGKIKKVASPDRKTGESIAQEIRQESWILNQNPDLYTIQLLATVDKNLLVEFVDINDLSHKAAIFHRYHKNRDWYSLIFGLYPSWSEAMKELKGLPEHLTKASPWVIRVNRVQDLITMKRKSDNP